MDKMVDHLIVFEGEGAISDILGNYTVFRKKKQSDQKAARKVIDTAVEPIVVEAPKVEEPKKKLSYKEKQEFDSLEGDMERLEEEKTELTNVLSSGTASNEELMTAGERISVVVAELDQKSDRWLELSEYA